MPCPFHSQDGSISFILLLVAWFCTQSFELLDEDISESYLCCNRIGLARPDFSSTAWVFQLTYLSPGTHVNGLSAGIANMLFKVLDRLLPAGFLCSFACNSFAWYLFCFVRWLRVVCVLLCVVALWVNLFAPLYDTSWWSELARQNGQRVRAIGALCCFCTNHFSDEQFFEKHM